MTEKRERMAPKTKAPATKIPRKSKSRKKADPQVAGVPLSPDSSERARETPSPRMPSGDLPSVVVKDEVEALFHFAQIDDSLAEAWKRDVVMHKGPITIRRAQPSRFDATHYAYVDSRLIWYLKRDPSNELGARWEGYLQSARDAPRGSMAVMAGRDICAKKYGPQLGENPR